ncbi:hypothetical protein FOA52_000398 [Chlamydomonas sp. UWO 241]|nr:hypothetical protein FOA52_000398 [Chlamydomonas sp. UWO 241]
MTTLFDAMDFSTEDHTMHSYLWIVVCGGLAAAFMAWGIGANDVANSFATSVGSRTLKLWQAVIIAAVPRAPTSTHKSQPLWSYSLPEGIFEFAGAMALGGVTTSTVSSKISNVDMFAHVPEIYMYGMLCSLTIAGVWLAVATYLCLAVSTTHSIIGAVMGFSLVFGSWGGVIWHKEIGDFPYTSGFLPVVLSWFFSPIIGGLLAAIIFNLNRICILRRKHSTTLAIWSLPVLVFITFFINLLFVLAKGAKSDMQARWPCTKSTGYKGLPIKDCSDMYNASAWISAAAAGGLSIITGIIFVPLMLRNVRRRKFASEEAAIKPEEVVQNAGAEQLVPAPADSPNDSSGGGAEAADMDVDIEKVAAMSTSVKHGDHHPDDDLPQFHKSFKVYRVPDDSPHWKLPFLWSKHVYSKLVRQVIKGLFYNVHKDVSFDQQIQAIHAGVELFNPETERIYMVLQVFSASCVAFAHGSNDVANSIGPFSAIYTVYQTSQVPSSSTETPKWIFAMGGSMIVFGLMTYGYNIIQTIGVKLLALTPSRGFSAELAAGLTISLSSFYGIPVSTTQIIIGAETGIGMSESFLHGTNYWLLLRTFFGWIWTILLAVGFCAALFSAGAYAPSIIMAQELNLYNDAIFDTSVRLYDAAAQLSASDPAAVLAISGVNASLTPAFMGDGKEAPVSMTTGQTISYLNQAVAIQEAAVDNATVIGG